jgi:hypothetical protein
MMIFDDATLSATLDVLIVLGVALFALLAYVTRGSASSRPLKATDAVRSRINAPNQRVGRSTETLAWSCGALSPSGAAARQEEAHKRSSLRRDGNPIEVLVSAQDGAAPPIPGTVIDRSRGGLRIRVPESLPVSSLLKVRASHSPEELPWVQLDVRNCQAAGDKWDLGCQFTQDHTWGTLLLFG